MSLAGRKPKPNELKKLEGNPGRRPINEAAPVFAEIGERPPVDFEAVMDKRALEEWDRMIPNLRGLGIITTVDASLLVNYCITASVAMQAALDIQKHGLTYENETREGGIALRKNPAVDIFNQAAATCKTLMAEMGLTPSARSKLVVSKPEDDDPMDNLLRMERVK